MQNPVALIVDDERDILDLLSTALSRMGLDVVSAESIQQAKLLLGENRFDICLTDMRLGDGSGIDLISYVSEHYANMPIAMITAYGDVQSAIGNSAEADEHSQPLPEALARLEREQIRHALESCRYNKTKAAAQLGITFRALRYKMDKLGME
jgi:two-component system response regulator PilR (NtrC family)